MPNRRRRKLSTAMSAVAALAVASPCAYFLVYESTTGSKPPEHHDFKQAAVMSDLPGELMGALNQSQVDALNTLLIPHYTIYDLVLSYNQPKWDISVGIKNLTDVTYFSTALGSGASVGEPRTLFAKANLRW